MRVQRGSTRAVLLVGRWAFKVPTARFGIEQFLRGWLANLEERKKSRWCINDFINRASWSAPLGLLVRHERLEPVDEVEASEFIERLRVRAPWVDENPDNVGRHPRTGELLLLDYGD